LRFKITKIAPKHPAPYQNHTRPHKRGKKQRVRKTNNFQSPHQQYKLTAQKSTDIGYRKINKQNNKGKNID
jgi:hypothetical protein